MATIQKRETRHGVSYRVQIRIKGFPTQFKTFERLTDAKIWAQRTEAAIRDGDYRVQERSARGKLFKDIVDRYRREVVPLKSPHTQVTEQAYMRFWESELGEYGISYITPELISASITRLLNEDLDRREAKQRAADERRGIKREPRKRTRRTVKHYRDGLERIIRQAQRWGWIVHNPMDGVIEINNIKDGRDRFLSDEERDALLQAARENEHPYLYPIVVFALSTGARRGEILGLKLVDVDLNRGAAILRDTKNGDTRAVPIVHHLAELLREHIAEVNARMDELKIPKKERYLFPRPDGLAPIDVRPWWDAARAKAGLVDFRFHDLRHSAASYLAMNGASLVEIAGVLGHKTLQMVKRYAHLTDSHVKSVVTKMNQNVFAAEPPALKRELKPLPGRAPRKPVSRPSAP